MNVCFVWVLVRFLYHGSSLGTTYQDGGAEPVSCGIK